MRMRETSAASRARVRGSRIEDRGSLSGIFQRQLFELTALPFDIAETSSAFAKGTADKPLGQLAGARQGRLRVIDGDDLLRKATRLDRQVAVTAAEVRDHERRQQVPQRS